MKRDPLYSSRRRKPAPDPVKPAEVRASPSPNLYKRHERAVLLAAGVLVGLCIVSVNAALTPAVPALTQADLDAAVVRTLAAKPLPSPAVKAYQAVRESIVRVRAIGDGLEHDEYMQRAVGSGVVIIDKGVILTNLHVVHGASRILVTFYTGLESEATVVSTQPESDLAVIQATSIPDDLRAATLRSTKELAEGEHVTAVGFPFGIGPSVSAGIVSAILSTNGTFSGISFAVPIETAAGAAGLPPF